MPKAIAATMMVTELSGTPASPCTATTSPTGMALATSASLVEAADPDPFSDDQKNTLNRLIRDYIIQHPEVIMKSLQAMQEREQLAKDRQRASRIVALSDAIKHDPRRFT